MEEEKEGQQTGKGPEVNNEQREPGGRLET